MIFWVKWIATGQIAKSRSCGSANLLRGLFVYDTGTCSCTASVAPLPIYAVASSTSWLLGRACLACNKSDNQFQRLLRHFAFLHHLLYILHHKSSTVRFKAASTSYRILSSSTQPVDRLLHNPITANHTHYTPCQWYHYLGSRSRTTRRSLQTITSSR